jgi:hypothetical protein
MPQKKRMMAGISGLAAAAMASNAVWSWIDRPKTPREFFDVRCSECHTLPDLSRYKTSDYRVIVTTMREQNGARRVITDEEAVIIIEYLERSNGNRATEKEQASK